MTIERWARITGVFRVALDKAPGERTTFLSEACGGDEQLRRAVERLLAGEAEPSLQSPLQDFLEDGALELSPGETLAQYRLEAKIGEGGMGVVYRAYDTRLRRAVALKVLAPERFADLDRNLRLLGEARAASGLNHPNVVTIYEIGSDHDVGFIAMEHVDGKRLDELIPPEGLSAPDLLRYATQIANALARAHGAGIVHRDLKPSNIMVTPEQRLKLLDFGLAKSLDQADSDRKGSGFAAGALSVEGAVVGTPAYMSPEQAEGRNLDARSDVFSFGSVLYEMATGRRPFAAASRQALLASIVHDEPQPPRQIVPLASELEKLILRCLRKEPSLRYQTMEDLNAALEELEALESAGPSKGPVSGSAWLRRRLVSGTIVFLAAGTAIMFLAIRLLQPTPDPGSRRTVKFTIVPTNLLSSGSEGEIDAEVSISRDGKYIAYVESQNGQLWIREIDREQPHPVPGATSVYQVFWSPDNQFIGYAEGRGCGIRGGCGLVTIPVQGGSSRQISKLAGAFRRASWSSDGQTILYCDTTGMYTVPAKGGPVTRIVEHPHIEHPSFLDLPRGRRAYLFQAEDSEQRGHGIYVQMAGENRRLVTTSSSINPYPVYSATGHIVYVDGQRDSTAIWAVPFSLAKLQTTGKPFPIAQHGASPVLSVTGTLVYGDVPSGRKQLALVDRSGRTLAKIGEPQRQNSPRLSPDDRKLVIEIMEGDADLWVYDLDRRIKSRLTADAAAEPFGATWTPFGDRITYASNRSGNLDIYSKPSQGNGAAELLVGTSATEIAPDWSMDQEFLLYVTFSPATKTDILYREARRDGRLGEPKVFLKTPFDEAAPQFSPDGHFVVYVSDESGRNEVYVRDFPHAKEKWRISASGGIAPRWRRDGKEIVFVGSTGLMAVSVKTQAAFWSAQPVRLFDKRYLRSFTATGVSVYPQYDISSDGKRLAILDSPDGEPPLSVHVVHNWFEEFRGQASLRTQ